MKIPLNIYPSVQQAYVHPDDIAWVEWHEAVEFMRDSGKLTAATDAGKTDQWLYNFCEYRTRDFVCPDADHFNPELTTHERTSLIRRCKDNVLRIHCLLIDCDGGMDRAAAEAQWAGFEYVIYSTHGHRWVSGKDKFRMVLPLERPLTLVEAEERKTALTAITLGAVDKASFTVSQAFYFPTWCEHNAGDRFFEWRLGQRFPAHELPPEEVRVYSGPPQIIEDTGRVRRTRTADAILEASRTGSGLRYNDAIKLGCLYKQHGLTQEEFLATVNMIASPDSDYRRGKWDAAKLWGVSFTTMSTAKAKKLLLDLNCTKMPWI